MAIAGNGIPSFLVKIDRRAVVVVGLTQNVDKNHVQCDMSAAADALRANPNTMLRIDAKRLADLRDYLRATGEID